MNPLSSRRSSHHGAFAAGFYGVETRAHVREMKQAENYRKVGTGLLPRKQSGCLPFFSLLSRLLCSALLLSSRKVGRATNNGPKLPQR